LQSEGLFSYFTPLLIFSVTCSSLLVDLTDSDWSEEVGSCKSECATLFKSYNQEIKSLNNKKVPLSFLPIGTSLQSDFNYLISFIFVTNLSGQDMHFR